jgi:diaminohydroxyphosphoribosylaminopyrimidine deaminase/5-amino-6-(5-phosphoribosylamino)uracil reductase
MDFHKNLMRRCMRLAGRAAGSTSPNPMVGALLYKDDRIIAEDYHKKAGTPHAEALVLARAGRDSAGAILFVTLEPCCHRNKRTPPCTDAIIQSGVSEVVVGIGDPNPQVSGKGIAALEAAGIKVSCGLLEDPLRRQNESYIKYISTGEPFVTMKVAMTLDGKIATPEGESKWITSERSRALVHKMRNAADCVLTAIGTVKADNPRLTCRLPSGRAGQDPVRAGRNPMRAGRDPVRAVIDPRLETPAESHVLVCPPATIIVTTKERETSPAALALAQRGVEFIGYGPGEGMTPDGSLDLKWLMRRLGGRGITSVMIEGGSSLTGRAVEQGIIDKAVFFIAPKIIGGRGAFAPVASRSFRRMEEALVLSRLKVRMVGGDVLVEGYTASS